MSDVPRINCLASTKWWIVEIVVIVILLLIIISYHRLPVICLCIFMLCLSIM
jgi:hypothetical protein